MLLYELEGQDEGIHSIEINGKTIVLMFENKDDAQRYCGLLEAQDFPSPSIEHIDRKEVELFCENEGYETRFVNNGFIPSSEEDRLLLTPPERNLDVSAWTESNSKNLDNIINKGDIQDDIDSFRKKLEDLI